MDLGISRTRATRFANSPVTSDFLCKSTGVCLTVAELFFVPTIDNFIKYQRKGPATVRHSRQLFQFLSALQFIVLLPSHQNVVHLYSLTLSLQDSKKIAIRAASHNLYRKYIPGPEVIKLFSCSTQLSMEFFLLINVKMPTIVGILTFMSGKNSILGLPEPKKCCLS